MAFWGVFWYYDFVSLTTQEVFSSPMLDVRNVGIVGGEQALLSPGVQSAAVTRHLGALAGKVKCLLRGSGWRAG